MYVAEDREGKTDDGEEPAGPAEVENMSQCLFLVPEGLQWSQPAARAAPGVGQIHLPRLPSVLFLPPHRRTPLTAWAATPAPGLFCGPRWAYGVWGGIIQLRQGYSYRRGSALTLDSPPAHIAEAVCETHRIHPVSYSIWRHNHRLWTECWLQSTAVAYL